MERVIAVYVQTPDVDDRRLDMQLEELSELVRTAGGQLKKTIIQKRDRYDNRTLVGKGKVAEIKAMADAHEADLVVFYQPLSPSQGRNIQEELDMPVIDRVQLILDIFAQHASSKEGKLQVALAQNEYLLPRLAGQGTSLSRLGGGIGTRGPGETKLEMDRRVLRHEIQKIKRELKAVEDHRQRTRLKRQDSPTFQIALFGYTNVGKSTILNQISAGGAQEDNKLFATLTPLTRQFDLENKFKLTITDTVGFIQDLPPQVIDAFHSTLEESRDVDLMLIVIDASSPYASEQQEVVLDLLAELEMNQTPHLFVYNKMDLVDEGQDHLFRPPYVAISARDETGMNKLKAAIIEQIKTIYQPFKMKVAPAEIGNWIAKQDYIYIADMSFDDDEQVYWLSGYRR
ncbi:GTPase HflX [Aerococcus urinaehominis]|uniref:GTPase HflX n=1 Tax=Aerococcus urinaehominis TaxID=128944 RepID=A0A0X8FK97_9LACT|nr:GTPase HflX [Aerococcus urinaehominis]AMB98855.1 GTPase HflX [Aerococcus urinaehominis]SDM17157.1 GTP-binding protein HflX [Aerococcus urinaehominis]